MSHRPGQKTSAARASDSYHPPHSDTHHLPPPFYHLLLVLFLLASSTFDRPPTPRPTPRLHSTATCREMDSFASPSNPYSKLAHPLCIVHINATFLVLVNAVLFVNHYHPFSLLPLMPTLLTPPPLLPLRPHTLAPAAAAAATAAAAAATAAPHPTPSRHVSRLHTFHEYSPASLNEPRGMTTATVLLSPMSLQRTLDSCGVQPSACPLFLREFIFASPLQAENPFQYSILHNESLVVESQSKIN